MTEKDIPYPDLSVTRGRAIDGTTWQWHIVGDNGFDACCNKMGSFPRKESKTNLTKETLLEMSPKMCHECWTIYFGNEAVEYICDWEEEDHKTGLIDKILSLIG